MQENPLDCPFLLGELTPSWILGDGYNDKESKDKKGEKIGQLLSYPEFTASV